MAGALSKNLTRIVVLVVVAAIVVGGAIYLFTGNDMKTVKARFTAAVGVYEGTPVRQLGVNVGDVTAVQPKGTYVEVTMEYESQYSLPVNATAVEVANSLVSDRFIQLSPYPGKGDTLASGATIPLNRTGAPAELDDIYKALNTLSVALGPNGANSNGALSELLKVGSANLKGNGTAIGQSIANLSKAAKTLADNRGNLFGTVTNLRKFTDALNESDGQVRKFNTQLATVSGQLASERTDLGGALKLLGLALNDVNSFVRKNAGKFHTSVVGLRKITDVLQRQKAALNETLAIAPVALANLTHSYQPNLGVLATRSNLASLIDPGQICVLVKGIGDGLKNSPGGGTLGDLLGSVANVVATGCDQLLKGQPDLLKLLQDPAIKKAIQNVVGAIGLPTGPILGGKS